jgi:hypothetical protein
MSSPIVQYLGFQAKLLVREYTFSVREAGSEREFTLNIANEAFCALRLNAELEAHSNQPPDSQFVITASELDSYRISHSPKVAPSPYGRKPKEDF